MECDGRQGQPAPGEVHDLPRRAPLDRQTVDPHERRRDDDVVACGIDARVVAHVVAADLDQTLVAQVGAERPHAGPVPGAGDQVPGVRAEHQPRHRPLRVRPQDVGVRKRERPEVRTAQPATASHRPSGLKASCRPYAISPLRRCSGGASGGLPRSQTRRPSLAGGPGQPLPGRVEGQRREPRGRSAPRGAELLPGRDLPDLHLAVLVDRRQALAVQVERHFPQPPTVPSDEGVRATGRPEGEPIQAVLPAVRHEAQPRVGVQRANARLVESHPRAGNPAGEQRRPRAVPGATRARRARAPRVQPARSSRSRRRGGAGGGGLHPGRSEARARRATVRARGRRPAARSVARAASARHVDRASAIAG